MKRKKLLDQLLLLLVALGMIGGLFWLMTYIAHRGTSKTAGFFIVANIFLSMILSWNAIVSFHRTPHFWTYHATWMTVHAAIAVAWGYSGVWVELCVVVLPLEAYIYFKVMESRLRRLGNPTLPLSPGSQALS